MERLSRLIVPRSVGFSELLSKVPSHSNLERIVQDRSYKKCSRREGQTMYEACQEWIQKQDFFDKNFGYQFEPLLYGGEGPKFLKLCLDMRPYGNERGPFFLEHLPTELYTSFSGVIECDVYLSGEWKEKDIKCLIDGDPLIELPHCYRRNLTFKKFGGNFGNLDLIKAMYLVKVAEKFLEPQGSLVWSEGTPPLSPESRCWLLLKWLDSHNKQNSGAIDLGMSFSFWGLESRNFKGLEQQKESLLQYVKSDNPGVQTKEQAKKLLGCEEEAVLVECQYLRFLEMMRVLSKTKVINQYRYEILLELFDKGGFGLFENQSLLLFKEKGELNIRVNTEDSIGLQRKPKRGLVTYNYCMDFFCY